MYFRTSPPKARFVDLRSILASAEAEAWTALRGARRCRDACERDATRTNRPVARAAVANMRVLRVKRSGVLLFPDRRALFAFPQAQPRSPHPAGVTQISRQSRRVRRRRGSARLGTTEGTRRRQAPARPRSRRRMQRHKALFARDAAGVEHGARDRLDEPLWPSGPNARKLAELCVLTTLACERASRAQARGEDAAARREGDACSSTSPFDGAPGAALLEKVRRLSGVGIRNRAPSSSS